MKKKGKRILSLIISICMLLSNIPTTVFAENLQLDEIEIIEEIPEEMPEEMPAFEEAEEVVTDGTIFGVTVSQPAVGDGSSEKPYVLTNKEELYWFSGLVNGHEAVVTETIVQNTAACAILGADIVVNEGAIDAQSNDAIAWMPIGSDSYTGTFDGGGYTISGLYCNESDMPAGLFGTTASGCTIQNLGVVNSYFASNNSVGSIVGYAENTTICACFSTAAVAGGADSLYVGGLGGYFKGSVRASFCAGNVTGPETALLGAICGYSFLTLSYDVFYLNTTAAAGLGDTVSTYVKEATAEQFASGEVTYQMNLSIAPDAWYQNLEEDGDPYPVLDDSHRVVYPEVEQNCDEEDYIFTGYNNEARKVSEVVHHTKYAHGLCTVCGKIEDSLMKEPSQDADGIYLISSKEELYWFAEHSLSNTDMDAKLTQDIVVNEGTITADSKDDENILYWKPIRSVNSFDGAGHTVSGLYITSRYNENQWCVGFIHTLGGGSWVKNLGILNSYAWGDQYVGAIVGMGANKGTLIENCYSNSTIEGDEQVGGIVGRGWDMTIRGCYNTGNITARSGVGGINGTHNSATIDRCYNLGTITCTASSQTRAYVGGLIGDDQDSDSVIMNSYNAGTVVYQGTTINSLYMGGISPDIEGVWTNVINYGKIRYTTSLPSNALIGGAVGKIHTDTALLQNVYYDEDLWNWGSGTGQSLGDEYVIPASKEQLASGEITYKLNLSNIDEPVWYQTIGTDSYPILDSTHGTVYATATRVCPGVDYTFTELNNTSGSVSDGAHEYGEDEICIHCKRYNPEAVPELVDGVYQIYNEIQLKWYAGLVSNWKSVCYGNTVRDTTAKAILMADIDLGGSSNQWSSITNFAGSFNGNGHTISGLYDTNSFYSGMFHTIKAGGYVHNLHIKNAYLQGEQFVGGIASYNYGTIRRCSFEGQIVDGGAESGGIAGVNEGTIENCWTKAEITGEANSYLGGLVGSMKAGTLKSCYSLSTFTIPENTEMHYGGLVGSLAGGTVTNCCYLEADGLEDSDAAKSAEAFASGEVTYILNGNSSVGWNQTLGEDEVPVLNVQHGTVYPSVRNDCAGNVVEVVGYNNTKQTVVSTEDHVYGEDQICTVCGMYSHDLMPEVINGVYQISNAFELELFVGLVNGDDTVCDETLHQNSEANAILTADITMNEGTITTDSTDARPWTPIGKGTRYAGTFDGNGHTISGLYCVNSAKYNSYVGFIGELSGTVKNLTITNSYFEGLDKVGGIAASQETSSSRIYNCINEASVVLKSGGLFTNRYAGGIAGKGYYIYQCLNRGTVSTDIVEEGIYVGGLCGESRSTLSGSLNLGTVQVPENTEIYYGSIVGYGSFHTGSCFYLSEDSTLAGVGAVTIEQLASGEVTYQLNGSTYSNPAWYQTLGTDPEPVLADDSHGVVYATGRYACPNAELELTGYANSPSTEVGEHDFTELTYYCCYCGMKKPANQAEDGYYEISNIHELYWFAEELIDNPEVMAEANVRLTADLVDNENVENLGDWDNMTSEDWDNVNDWKALGGNGEVTYSGIFDGNGHTISQLYCDESEYSALFAWLDGAVVKNLKLKDCYFAGSYLVGSIAAQAEYSVIKDCEITGGEVYAADGEFVGGLAGCINYTTIQNCVNQVEVYGDVCNYVGGIVGGNYFSTITECSNSGNVTGSNYVGGIAGLLTEPMPNSTESIETAESVMKNCFNAGDVSGDYAIGGLAGGLYEREVSDSYNCGVVTGKGEFGGLIGYRAYETSVDHCYYLDTAAPTAIGVNDDGTVCALSSEEMTPPSEYGEDGEVLYARTAEQFGSGEVTFLLNHLKSDSSVIWRQKIGTDDYPTLDGSDIVYSIGERDCNGVFSSFEGYTNDSTLGSEFPEHNYVGGKCEKCGEINWDVIPEKDVRGVYQIGTPAELYSFAAIVNGTHKEVEQDLKADAVLTADIKVNDLFDEDGNLPESPEGLLVWDPIGNGKQDNVYSGTFDGQGYSIEGLLCYEESEMPLGLFGVAASATIQNVSVIDSMFVNGYEYVGGIAGVVYESKIAGCSFNGMLSGYTAVGGIIGRAGYSRINKCSTNAEINGLNQYIGGIVGWGEQCEITRCYNESDIFSYNAQYVGGIAGGCENDDVTWSNCYNVGEISGSDYVGGLLGFGDVPEIYHSYNYGNIVGYSGEDVGIGSLVGLYDNIEGALINCYYLEGTNPVGNPEGELSETEEDETSIPAPDYTGNPIAKTAEQFASGEVAFLLNENRTTNIVWYQTIGTDYPTFTVGDIVYAMGTMGCGNALLTFAGFTNHEELKAVPTEHAFENGICTDCGWLDYIAVPLQDENGVYQISTAEELYGFTALVNGMFASLGYEPNADAVLTNDIVINKNVLDENYELQGSKEDYLAWIPIGADPSGQGDFIVYKGNFDGQGYTISGLYAETDQYYDLGLFGALEGAVIENVTVTDSYICNTDYGTAGAIAGYAFGGTIVRGCGNESYIGGNEFVGGMVGESDESNCFESCYHSGVVLAKEGYAGGIVGSYGPSVAEPASVTDEEGETEKSAAILYCYNVGLVEGDHRVGGITGSFGDPYLWILDCYNAGEIYGNSECGGIAGAFCDTGNIADCYDIDNDLWNPGVTKVSYDEFRSGKVAYLMNGTENPVWYQNIGNDPFPVLDDSHGIVYAGYEDCLSEMMQYSNAPLFEKVPEHNYQKDTVLAEASCEVSGILLMKCSICGDEIVEEIPKTEHDLEDEQHQTIAPATCTSDGLKTITCAYDCGYTEKEVIPAIGHVFDETEVSLKTKEADHEAGVNGMTYWECRNGCGEIKVKEILPCQSVETAAEVLKADSAATTEEKIDALTTADNQALLDYDEEMITEAVTDLETVLITEGIAVDAGESTVTASIGESIYTVDATVENITEDEISVDGAAVTVAAAVKEGIENDSVAEGDIYSAQIALSEETTGVDEETGKAYYQVDISLNIVKTSVTENGTKETNVVAEAKQLEAPISITMPVPKCYQGMEFDLYHLVEKEDGTVTKELISYTLDKENQTICFVAPSISFYGFENGRCSEHNLDWDVIQSATCTEPGILLYHCINEYCDHEEQRVDAAIGHQYQATEDSFAEATCHTVGTAIYLCSSCEEEKSVTIERLPHSLGAWKETKAATCIAEGEKTRSCTADGCTYSETKEIDKLTYHVFDQEYTVDAEATCKMAGQKSIRCSVEGCTAVKKGSVQSIPVIAEHNWGEWLVTKEATVFAEGEKVRTCKTCGSDAKETDVVEKAAAFIKLNATWIPLKVKQSTTKVKVSMAKGDYVKSWKSSNTKIVKVDASGKITAQSKTGSATLTVKLASGKSATLKVSVRSTSPATTKISGLSSKLTLAKGKTYTLKPVITPITSLSKTTYASSNVKVATVSSKGVITAKAPGSVKITVTSGTQKSVVTVTVPGISYLSPKIMLKKGASKTLDLKKYGTSSPLVYATSDSKVVTVSSTGVIKAVGIGKATITVTAGSYKRTSVVTVPGVTNVKSKLTLAKGKKYVLEPAVFGTTSTVKYSSSNKSVAVVYTKGTIKAINPGKATITVTAGSYTAKCVVTVPGISNVSSGLTLEKGKTATLAPKIYGTSSEVTYTTSDAKVATVSSTGVIKAVNPGKATINVTAGAYQKTCVVTVPGIANVSSKLTLEKGKTFVLEPVVYGTSDAVKFTSSNKKVAVVYVKGTIKAVGIGKATITVTAGTYKKTCTVTVK